MIVLGAYAALRVASLLCCVAQIAVRWVCSPLRTRRAARAKSTTRCQSYNG